MYVYIYTIYVNQKKNVNIGIACDLLNTLQSISTSHSTSHATLFWWWQKHRNTKYYSVRTWKYDSGLITKFYSGTFPYYKVQQRTKKYCKGLNCRPFDSRSTWNVQYIAWSNLCDAKHNGITTFMFDSRNTWKLICVGWSNLYGAKRNGSTTFYFTVAAHETSVTLRRATSGTQKAMELRHLCLIAAMHETWFTLCGVSDVPPPTSTNIALATTNDPHDFLSSSHMKRSVQMTLMICLHHKWNVQCNKRSNRSHPQTSPKIAAAKKNESQDWSASSIKRPVQCAEHQASPSNITK